MTYFHEKPIPNFQHNKEKIFIWFFKIVELLPAYFHEKTKIRIFMKKKNNLQIYFDIGI